MTLKVQINTYDINVTVLLAGGRKWPIPRRFAAHIANQQQWDNLRRYHSNPGQIEMKVPGQSAFVVVCGRATGTVALRACVRNC